MQEAIAIVAIGIVFWLAVMVCNATLWAVVIWADPARRRSALWAHRLTAMALSGGVALTVWRALWPG